MTCVDVWDRIVLAKGNPYSNHEEISWMESMGIDPLLVYNKAILSLLVAIVDSQSLEAKKPLCPLTLLTWALLCIRHEPGLDGGTLHNRVPAQCDHPIPHVR